MTQGKAFDILKQTVLDAKGDLKDISITVTNEYALYSDGKEKIEPNFYVRDEDDGTTVTCSKNIEKAIIEIRAYYDSLPNTILDTENI